MLFRQLRIGHRHKLLLDFQFAGYIAETADEPVPPLSRPIFHLALILAGMIKRQQRRTHQHEEQNSTRKKFHKLLVDADSDLFQHR